ncbi:hypothetical protein [Actinoplanes awajinensis]|nr:hypothetical protein [Actinoplanes awajinensis]
MSSRSVSLTSTFLLLAAGGAAACSNDKYYDEGFYCADENGVIVDEDFCDDNGGRTGVSNGYYGGYYLYHSPSYRSGYPIGTKLPSGGSRFAYNDSASRSSYGLPSSGRVGNGTVKSSVVGKGGSGSHGSSGG